MTRAYAYMCLFVLLSVSIGKAAVTMNKSRQKRSRGDSKIVGGKDVTADWYHYMVAIIKYDKNRPIHDLSSPFRCGSVLFHLKFAVTTCDCTTNLRIPREASLWSAAIHRPPPLTDEQLAELYGWGGAYKIWEKGPLDQIRNISRAYHHKWCELRINHRISVDDWLVFNVGIFEFKTPFIKQYNRVELAPLLNKQAPNDWEVHETRLMTQDFSRANCYVAGWGATLVHAKRAEEYCCYAITLKDTPVLPKNAEFCADAHCLRLLKTDRLDRVPNCHNKTLEFYPDGGSRCGIFYGTYGNIGPGDYGGPLSCTISTVRNVVGILSHTHPGIDYTTFYYIPMSVLYPYIDEFKDHHPAFTSSSTSLELDGPFTSVIFIQRIFIPLYAVFLMSCL